MISVMRNPFKNLRKPKTIHLDYASTTPVAPEVLKAMLPYFTEEWANPSAIYTSGVRVREVLEEVRKDIARMLRIRASGVLFTSGGTESNNHALIGIVEALHAMGKSYEEMEIVTTPIEHASIIETCEALRKRGVTVHMVPVTEAGHIDEKEFARLLSPNTVLVSFAYVNSEIGVIQDVKRLTRLVRTHNSETGSNTLVHLDASQAPLWLSCEMDMLGVDLLTLDSGKCYGPKGAGVLALRHGVTLAPFMYGGGHEGGRRSGTENVPLIVGLHRALVRAQKGYKERSARVLKIRDEMIEHLLKGIPGSVVNGSREERVANNVNVSIPGIDSEYAVITLDAGGIAAGTKSACGSMTSSGSYVVRAITNDDGRATSTIRFTLGEETTREECRTAVVLLARHVAEMRSFQEKITHAKIII
jgi:cysteine desulfurase